MWDRLIRWWMFGVLASLLPLAVAFLTVVSYESSTTSLPAWKFTIGSGELLLVSAGIGAAAAGETIGRTHRLRKTQVAAGGAAILVVLGASLWFGDLYSAFREGRGDEIDQNVVAWGSLVFLAATVVVGAVCVALGDDQ